LTDGSIAVKASVGREVTSASLIVATDAGFASPMEFPASLKVVSGYDGKIFVAGATELTPNTQYHYQLKLNGAPVPATRGRFSTAPVLGTPSGFSFGLASCANDGTFAGTSSTAAYEALRRTPNLLFFFHLGDLHYANLRTDEVARRLKAYDEKIGQVGIGELFRAMPVPYTWDDHDFLGDDSCGADPAISANTPKARLAYDLYVPHYGLPADAGIYQSFQIGRVFFIATDSRSFQRRAAGGVNGTLLGEKQLAWFKGELLRGKALDLIVWANSAPWVIESSNPADDDDWGSRPSRQEDLCRPRVRCFRCWPRQRWMFRHLRERWFEPSRR
jgi:phosphodiesterase/alkaline phosphatase D-like protein